MSSSLHSPFVSIGHFHCHHNNQNHISPPPSTTTTLASPPYRCQQRKEIRSVLTLSSNSMDICGVDSEGKEFNSVQEMWREEIGEGDETRKTQWYRDGVSYWEVSI